MQVDRAAEVVRRLRDFIQLGRNEMRPHAAADLIREAISHCRFDLMSSHVEVETRIARNLPIVFCDALQIQQVLVNLIRNAAESISGGGRPDGRISVEADLKEPGRVMLTVDNGLGFDAEILERALTPFTTTSRKAWASALLLPDPRRKPWRTRSLSKALAVGPLFRYSTDIFTPPTSGKE